MPELLRLEGCTPEPLMGYLKALGVLRLLAEKADPAARSSWAGDTMVLHTRLSADQLLDYFAKEYIPTPIVVPWSGSDFFKVRQFTAKPPYAKTPSSEKVVRAFLETDSPRLAEYRAVIESAVETLQACGLTDSSQMEGTAKLRFLSRLRSTMTDRFIDWLDAATVLEADKPTYSVLVGTTGGSDGNTHLSDNFMKNLWDLFPEFDAQRSAPKRGQEPRDTLAYSKRLLSNALFGATVPGLSDDKTASLYDPGATGGANAGQGMFRGPLLNPWNFVLALEGCTGLAGSVARRINASSRSSATFPFQVQLSAGGTDTASQSEQVNREVWLPLWSAPTCYREVSLLLAEGRVTGGREVVRRGVDVARAIAELGVDRGISAFQRYGIIRSRVGGDRYSAAVSMGRFQVHGQRNAELLHDLSGWLELFRSACRSKSEGAKVDPPSRFPTALRRIDAAIFEFCKYGGPERLADILAALGRAERELAVGDFPPDKRRTPRPLSGLSSEWLTACNDGTPEYRLARAVASIRSPTSGKVPALRANLEPVEPVRRGWAWVGSEKAQRGSGASREGTSRSVVWSGGSLAGNFGAVLLRRLLDAEKAGEDLPPLSSSSPVTLADVARFLQADTDDGRLEDLVWGCTLASQADEKSTDSLDADICDAEPLPREYALLKLTLLPGRMGWVTTPEGMYLRCLRQQEPDGVRVRAEAGMLSRLRAGDVAGACELAVRRLRVAGFSPLPGLNADGSHRNVCGEFAADATRFLASLLIPITDTSVNTLGQMVLRHPTADVPV